MKQTVFIKVDVKDRLPNVSGRYFTSFGECTFSRHFNKWSFMLQDCTSYVDYWLEEIELDLTEREYQPYQEVQDDAIVDGYNY